MSTKSMLRALKEEKYNIIPVQLKKFRFYPSMCRSMPQSPYKQQTDMKAEAETAVWKQLESSHVLL